MTDAKEQRFLERFEVLFMRVHHGMRSGGAQAGGVSFTTGLSPSSSHVAGGNMRRRMMSGSTLGGARPASPSGRHASRRAGGSGDVDGSGLPALPSSGLAAYPSDMDSVGLGGSTSDPSGLGLDIASEAFQLVDAMPTAEQERYASAICAAIRRHVHFPPPCGERTVEGKITFPRSYILGLIPSCTEQYDFSDRNFALKIPRIAFDAITLLRNDDEDDEAIESLAALDAADAATAAAPGVEDGGVGAGAGAASAAAAAAAAPAGAGISGAVFEPNALLSRSFASGPHGAGGRLSTSSPRSDAY